MASIPGKNDVFDLRNRKSTSVTPVSNGLPVGGSANQILSKIDGTDYNAQWVTNTAIQKADPLYVLVRNNTGSTLTKGTIVYTNGATGGQVTVAPALATSDATSARTLGWVSADILNNDQGYVQIEGTLVGIDTTGASADGAIVYLSATTAGSWTTTKPHAPTHLVYCGVVVKKAAANGGGGIQVKVQNGYELDEIHNVDTGFTNALATNDVLSYDATAGLWYNKTLANAGIASSTHVHGNITNAGALTTTVTAASAVKMVITDSTTNLLGTLTVASSPTTQFLRGDGTWVVPTISGFSGAGTSVTSVQSAAGVALPISTATNGAASGAITIATGTTTSTSSTSGSISINTGDGAGAGNNSGAITIQSGAGSGSTGNSGNVTIDAGIKSGGGTVGTVGIGTTNATTTLVGTSASTPTVNRLVSIGGASGTTSTGAFSHSANLGNWYAIATGGTAFTTVGGGFSLGTGGTSTINIGSWSNSLGTQTIAIGTNNGTSTTTLNGITNLAGSLNLVAGTTALNPIKFTANSSTPTLAAGVVDYDGTAFYATPKVNNTTAGKGLIPTQQYFIPSSNTTIVTTSTAGTVTGNAMGGKTIYLAASTTYEVEAVLYVQTSWTVTAASNATINLLYPTGSTALIQAIWSYSTLSGAIASSAVANQLPLNTTTAVVLSTAPTSGNYIRVELKGIVKTSTTAGNFSPVFGITNASVPATSTLTIAANSFIKVNPIGGVGADINIGGWA